MENSCFSKNNLYYKWQVSQFDERGTLVALTDDVVEVVFADHACHLQNTVFVIVVLAENDLVAPKVQVRFMAVRNLGSLEKESLAARGFYRNQRKLKRNFLTTVLNSMDIVVV